MPSFVCDTCQDALKKGQLEQHSRKCRNSKFSCIDCNKTFKNENEWKSHTSCITEVEKYHKPHLTKRKVQEEEEEKKLDPKKSKSHNKECEKSELEKILVKEISLKDLKSKISKSEFKTLLAQIHISLPEGGKFKVTYKQ